MIETAAPGATGSAAWAETLLLSFAQAGYVQAEPSILQPAEPFLDLSGEDIRRRMFLIADAANTEFCLRPDLTIPVACDYLASAAAGKPAKYCYLGPVFRDLGARSAELMQAGIESFGRTDTAAADAETIARLEDEGRVLYRYVSPQGELDPAWNLNGATNSIAGILNERGNVLGMMPHPENHVEAAMGCTDGRGLFAGLVEHVVRAA